MTETRETIDFGKLSDQQIAFLECVEWHLEAFPGDADRLRMVYPTINAVGKWFSRYWKPVSWEFIRPA